MARTGLSVPALIINNVTIPIVPNSLKYDGGEGEQNVRAASSGGGEVESVVTVNAETKISMVSFDIFTTTDADSKISDWKIRIGQNTIQFNQNVGGFPNARSFDHMSCTDIVEREVGADTVTSLVFKGDPMTAQ